MEKQGDGDGEGRRKVVGDGVVRGAFLSDDGVRGALSDKSCTSAVDLVGDDGDWRAQFESMVKRTEFCRGGGDPAVGIAAMNTILAALSAGHHDAVPPAAPPSPQVSSGQAAEQPGHSSTSSVDPGVAVIWNETELLDFEIRVQEAAVESAKSILAEKVARRKRLQEDAAAGASLNKVQRISPPPSASSSAVGCISSALGEELPSQAAAGAGMRANGAVELPDDDDSSAEVLYQGHSLLDDRVQEEVDSLFEDGEQLVVPKSLFSSDNAHPLLKELAPSVLEHVRFVRVFFCHHAIANYNGIGFILCRLSVMPITSTAGQAHL